MVRSATDRHQVGVCKNTWLSAVLFRLLQRQTVNYRLINNWGETQRAVSRKQSGEAWWFDWVQRYINSSQYQSHGFLRKKRCQERFPHMIRQTFSLGFTLDITVMLVNLDDLIWGRLKKRWTCFRSEFPSYSQKRQRKEDLILSFFWEKQTK